MRLNIFVFPFIIGWIRSLISVNPELYLEIRQIRSTYPAIWKIVCHYTQGYIHIIREQHNMVRQLVIFHRERRFQLLQDLNAKATIILASFPEILLDEQDRNINIAFLMRNHPLGDTTFIELNMGLGGLVDNNFSTSITHGELLEGFMKWKIKKYPDKYEFFNNLDIHTYVKSKSIEELRSDFRLFFSKHSVELTNKSGYFWVTNDNFFDPAPNDFENIFYNLGFPVEVESNEGILIMFKLNYHTNVIFKTTVFSDGCGPLYRPMYRADHWGETVHTSTLDPGVTEGLVARQIISEYFELGDLTNLIPVPNEDLYQYQLLIKSLDNFILNW